MNNLLKLQAYLYKRSYLHYTFAIVLSFALLYLKEKYHIELTDTSPYLLLVFPVVLSSWFGGFWPGLLATAICTVVIHIHFIQPQYAGRITIQDIRTALFFFEGLLISLLSEGRLRLEKERMKLLSSEQVSRDLAEKESERSKILYEVNKTVSSSIDYKTTLETVVNQMVPKFADWAILDVIENNKFKRLKVLHKNPKLQKYSDEIQNNFPPDPSAVGGAGKVLRTGKPLFYPAANHSVLKATARNNPDILDLLLKSGIDSFIIVPLNSRKKTLGALSLVRNNPKKRYTQKDFILAQELAQSAAIAVDNALLYSEATLELSRRKQTEEQLKSSLKQLKIILKNAADGIVVRDKDGNFVYANQAIIDSLNYGSVKVLKESKAPLVLSRFDVTDEKGKKITNKDLPHNKILNGKDFVQQTLKYRDKQNNQIKWFSVTSNAVRNNKNKLLYIITILHDLTDRKLLEQQRNTFISMAGHELKTPLTSISAYIHLIRKKLNQEDLKIMLSKVDIQLGKLTMIINDLIDISKLRSEKLEYLDREFSFDQLINEVIDDTNQITKTHQIELVGNTNVTLIADKNRIYQVLANILSNSIKYSPNANKVIVSLRKNHNFIRVGVKDFGLGIPKAQQQTIFESFSRIDDKQRKGIPGTGLGLYLANQIIKHYKGNIQLESQEGKGSTFYINLPTKLLK